MVYAAILAGGSGSRMNSDLPKQYMKINGKPVIAYSAEAFAACPEIESIVVAVSEDYMKYAENLFSEYCLGIPLTLIAGGADRTGTLKNILEYMRGNNMLGDETILLTHDAARPFIDSRIINDNIAAAREAGACNTVIPATDTILESLDGEYISFVPNRDRLYHVQTPQSFRAKKLYELTLSLSDAERGQITDACSIFTLRGEPVKLVRGKAENIKITWPQDIFFAEIILNQGLR